MNDITYTVELMVEENLDLLRESQRNFGGVYVAILDVGVGHSVEVELDDSNLAFSLHTGDFVMSEEDHLETLAKIHHTVAEVLRTNEIKILTYGEFTVAIDRYYEKQGM